MGRNSHLREVIEGLEQRIREHEQKIEEELRKPKPDQGWIEHWRKEIRAFANRRDRLLRRLYRRRS